MNVLMDDIRRLADRIDDNQQVNAKDVKALLYNACGYAESLMKLSVSQPEQEKTKLQEIKDRATVGCNADTAYLLSKIEQVETELDDLANNSHRYHVFKTLHFGVTQALQKLRD